MIWLALVALVFVAGGAWLISRSWLMRGLVFFAGLAAAVVYVAVGRPNMADEPLAGRLNDIEAQAAKDPQSMTAAQLMALAEKRAKDDPKSPMPHWIMGEILEAAGQPNEALMAFEAALRRDPNHLPTIKDLADLRFKLAGGFDEATTALYHEVYKSEPDNLRAGYMAGIGDWQAGRKAEAEALWAEIEAKGPDATQKQMFAAFRQMFVDPPKPETQQPQTPPG